MMNNIRLASALLIGFSTGSASASFYYQRQLTKERQAFLECQLAWKKYYSLNNQPSQVTQPITSNQSLWQLVFQSSLRIAQNKVQEFNQPFTSEQQKYLVYHYEILPKCRKIQDWIKETEQLVKKTK